ncbi:hypothetical protein BX600DRAFT_440905 [Xylariales sp. PMI_506]|nr:hypothetical protein BX600DRAFT_440905 [Xylariales sp. PMI_506]
MAFNLVPIAHIAAAIFAAVELGLTAYLASLYTGHSYAWSPDYDEPIIGYSGWVPSIISFMVFASAWSLLVLLYIGLTPLYLTSIFHKIASVALNCITACFWFGGSVALAVEFGGPPGDCGASAACGSVRAAITLGFFLCALFVFLAIVDTFESLRSRGHNPGKHFHARGPTQQSQPTV